MRKVFIPLFIFLFSFNLTFAQKVALIVGIYKYDKKGRYLAFKKDLELMEKEFNCLGFKITRLDNPTDKEFKNKLEKIKQSLNKGDVFVLYYTGHGIKLSDGKTVALTFRNYDDEKGVGYIENSELNKTLRQIRARKLIIIDSCYSGGLKPFDIKSFGVCEKCKETKSFRTRDIVRSYGKTIKILSSREDEISFYDKDGSVFTKRFFSLGRFIFKKPLKRVKPKLKPKKRKQNPVIISTNYEIKLGNFLDIENNLNNLSCLPEPYFKPSKKKKEKEQDTDVISNIPSYLSIKVNRNNIVDLSSPILIYMKSNRAIRGYVYIFIGKDGKYRLVFPIINKDEGVENYIDGKTKFVFPYKRNDIILARKPAGEKQLLFFVLEEPIDINSLRNIDGFLVPSSELLNNLKKNSKIYKEIRFKVRNNNIFVGGY